MTNTSNEAPDADYDIKLLTNADFSFVSNLTDSGVHVIRNPLDLICSAYYSHKSTHPILAWSQLVIQRKILKGLPRPYGLMATVGFLDRLDFDSRPVLGPLLAMRTWDYDDGRFVTLRMEDVTGQVNTLIGQKIRERFGNQIRLPEESEFEFQKFSGDRRPGERDDQSHYRVGLPGQWKEEMPPWLAYSVILHNQQIFDRFYPESQAYLSQSAR